MYVGVPPGEEGRISMLKEVPWTRDQALYVFVEPADKAAGIRQVMDYYGAPYEDVVVFGDQRNDLSMFYPEEWTCIAMGNACDEVKARATYVTKNVREDGLAHALRHFGWID
jgi:hydroxymethylpyrimidine pyrophosphatase-like HAD family hydrolase